MRVMDPRPVGVFDSGVGGLTVLHECLVTMPHEDFVYLGDHARLPYGPRQLDEVRGFALEIGAYLEPQVKLLVVACNTATSAALPQLQEQLSVPVVGVIQPEARAAVQATRNRRIGLLATEGTVAAGRYDDFVAALDAGVELTVLPCPRLVPLIESDDPFGAETTEAARVGAPLPGEDEGALHGLGRRRRAAVAPRQGSRLDDGGVLAAAGLHGRPDAARGLTRQAGWADGRDPAPDRPRAALRHRLRG